MNGLKTIIIAVTGLLAAVPLYGNGGLDKSSYKGELKVALREMQRRGDSLYISILYDFSDIKLPSNLSLELIPVLTGGGHHLALPSVSLKGRNNYNVFNRRLALMGKAERALYEANPPYTVMKNYGRNRSGEAVFRTAILFRPWMEQARLDLRQEISVCCESSLLNVVSLAPGVTSPDVEPYTLEPCICYLLPTEEPVKNRIESIEMSLDFIVGRTDIRPQYMNNSTELGRVCRLLQGIQADSTLTVTGIEIAGFASPEGSQARNRQLSEGRAHALAAYLLPLFRFAESLYEFHYGGENWEGLREAVASSDMPDRDEIIDVIDNIPAEIDYATNSSRKKTLMSLRGGVPYRYMLRNFFPHLRKAVCTVRYRVKGFDAEQAKSLIDTKPEKLSLREIYSVAMTYEPGSPEFIALCDTAVRLFPGDPTANLNAAAGAAAEGDAVSARSYIGKAHEGTPEYDNIMGIILLLEGDYAGARVYLERAAGAGLKEACFNLEELEKAKYSLRNEELRKR